MILYDRDGEREANLDVYAWVRKSAIYQATLALMDAEVEARGGDGRGSACLQRAPEGTRSWVCSRKKGHATPIHIAWASGANGVLLIWTEEEEAK